MLQACSHAPLNPVIDASTAGKGKIRINLMPGPAMTVGGVYGVSNNTDIGIEIERFGVYSGSVKHAIVNNPDHISASIELGGFYSNTDGHTDPHGFFLGAAVTKRLNDWLSITGAYRANRVFYELCDKNSTGAEKLNDYSFEDNGEYPCDIFESESRNYDKNDLSRIDNVSANFTFKAGRRGKLNVGAACRYFRKNKNDAIDSDQCLLVLGFSIAAN